MSDLCGIIAPIKHFMSNTTEEIYISIGSEKYVALSLKEGRVYIIPDFQREIRWESENVAQLIDDIKSGPKYLGNIILTQHAENKYSIIDGQQRITILTMILSCIDKYHAENIDVIYPCKLYIESFSAFSTLLGKYFPDESEEEKEIAETDKLCQRAKYYELWKYIYNHPILKDKVKAEEFLENLGKSSVNVILNKSTDISDGIRYFIDVNLKGKQLDTEDIFKSYLFKNDQGSEIRNEWYKFKENVTKTAQYKMNYPLLKLLEHYFYCDLYKDSKYKGLDFGEDFTIKSEFKTREENPKTFREGIHIIELIRSKKYMLESLRNLNSIIEVMIEIVSSASTTLKFEKFFSCHEKGRESRLDPDELKIIHNLMKKILKDTKYLPKALIMKFTLSTLLCRENKSKEEVQRIYGVYLLAVLFSVFENKKSKDALLSVLKADDHNWYSALIEQIKSYFDPEKITENRLMAQYKLAINEEEDDYRFRCKSLATIYNFFKIENERVAIAKGKLPLLYKFITDNEKYSTEHFIINQNNNKTVSIVVREGTAEYQYDKRFYNRYVNSMFNYIFVPRELNSDLKDFWAPYKLSLIDTKKVDCMYSLMYLDKVKELCGAIENSVKTDRQYKDDLDLYFARDFKEDYVKFARDILKEVMRKIKG